VTHRREASSRRGDGRSLGPVAKGLIVVARLWLNLFYRLKVEGLQNLPLEGPCLLTPSHLGKLLADLTVFVIILPKRIPVVFSPTNIGDSTTGQFRAAGRRTRGLFGGSAGLMHMVPGSKLDNLNESMPSAESLVRILTDGEMVLLYPEGEVGWHGRLSPARPLAAWIALQSGAPIVPCAIDGAYDLWPRWADRPQLRGRLTIRFGQPYHLPPVTVDLDEAQQLEQAGARIMDEIQQLLDC